MIGIAIVKGVAGLAVTTGVGTIVKTAANTLTIEGISQAQKACVAIATVAIAGAINKKAVTYVNEQIDTVVELQRDLRLVVKHFKEKK